MKDLKIESIKTDELIPYANNPRFNDEAADYVANSIREFGFKVPIVIDKNNVIVSGHTRLKAAKLLGLKTVPCIRADDLTDDQVKAFRIADNKVSEYATWDYEKLELELEDIDIDMSSFGLELDEISGEDVAEWGNNDDGWYGDERLRTDRAYNLDLVDHSILTNDFWQMPTINNDHFIPESFIGFNYAKTSTEKNVGIHFYIDDYQFERVWNYPEKYIDILSEYECIISPDFSLYCDMPMPMKIWNTYRNRWIGSYFQSKGIKVIPNVRWDSEETYEFCFKGIPKGSIISVSTVSLKQEKELREMWQKGMKEAIAQIEPETILLYGGEIEFDYGGISVIPIENKLLSEWKDRAKTDCNK